MIHATIDAPSAQLSTELMITDALRCWQNSRAAGTSALPRLYRLLAARGRPMLAPAFDSLLRLFEDWPGRQSALTGSKPFADETLLMTLLEEATGIDTPFESALSSTRAMLWKGL